MTLSDDAEGEQIADTLWNPFLSSTKHRELRPFSDVRLDGLELDK